MHQPLCKTLFTSVDKLFDAAPVVDEVCALLDWILTLGPRLPWHLEISTNQKLEFEY